MGIDEQKKVSGGARGVVVDPRSRIELHPPGSRG